MSDGQPVKVFLLPESEVTPELGVRLEEISAYYAQPIHNIVPDVCEHAGQLVDEIDSMNPVDDDDDDEAPSPVVLMEKPWG